MGIAFKPNLMERLLRRRRAARKPLVGGSDLRREAGQLRA
jgi:hypothetical protein